MDAVLDDNDGPAFVKYAIFDAVPVRAPPLECRSYV